MNRKLHNTILAFSVTGVMFAMGLMAAQPLLPQADIQPVATVAAAPIAAPIAGSTEAARIEVALVAASEAPVLAADALAARIESHGLRYEAQVQRSESLEQALAATAGFIAAVAAEAAVAGALGEPGAEAPEARVEQEHRPATPSRRGSVRSAIAVPYFSFARGIGRGDRS